MVLIPCLRASALVSNGISSIEAYCKQLDQFVKNNPDSFRIFANIGSGLQGRKDIWREFKTDEERNNADNGENLNDNVRVWLKSGSIIIADCLFQSPSRDWTLYVTYYFREDGSLAKLHSVLNTFYGHISAIRDRYYSPSGNLLRSSAQYFDLGTKKRKKPGKDFQDEHIPEYLNSKNLPCSDLLKAP
jgi:hypothetical protein